MDAVTAAAMRARTGDQDAAEEFVRATQADVWRLCRHLGDPSTADDLTQETYARAFGSLHRFAGRASARTWLLSIARRVCADAVRTAIRNRQVRPGSAQAARAGLAGPSTETTDPSEAVGARALLDALEPERREAFVLTQLIGLSYAEAADVCHCPIGTIRSRVARARAELIVAFGATPRRASGG